MRPPLTAQLAYLTADIPGTGGIIKARPEDFRVEELPLYPPSGQGEHLYLLIEKRQRTTPDVVRRLAKLFNVRKSDIGYAGLKDKHAVTRQTFSIHLPRSGGEEALLPKLEFTGLKLLGAARHGNKLRRGHLAGNRFTLMVRQVQPAEVLQARRVLDRLVAQGVPNFVGEQRFGYRQNNHLLGRLLLLSQWREFLDAWLGRPDAFDPPPMRDARQAYEQGDFARALELWPRKLHHDRQALDLLRQGKTAEQTVRGIDRNQLEFLLNSLQSALFNRVLDARLREGAFAQLKAGDIAVKHANGALFAVDEETARRENAPEGRVPQQAVSPTGPMWGPHMLTPTGQVYADEQAPLREMNLTEADFNRGDLPAPLVGDRRPLRALVRNPDISAGSDDAGPYLRLCFDLPPGSYATIVLREIIKPEITGATLPESDAAVD